MYTGESVGMRALLSDLAHGTDVQRKVYAALAAAPRELGLPSSKGAANALAICDALEMHQAASDIRAGLRGRETAFDQPGAWTRLPELMDLDLDLRPLVPPDGAPPDVVMEPISRDIDPAPASRRRTIVDLASSGVDQTPGARIAPEADGLRIAGGGSEVGRTSREELPYCRVHDVSPGQDEETVAKAMHDSRQRTPSNFVGPLSSATAAASREVAQAAREFASAAGVDVHPLRRFHPDMVLPLRDADHTAKYRSHVRRSGGAYANVGRREIYTVLEGDADSAVGPLASRALHLEAMPQVSWQGRLPTNEDLIGLGLARMGGSDRALLGAHKAVLGMAADAMRAAIGALDVEPADDADPAVRSPDVPDVATHLLQGLIDRAADLHDVDPHTIRSALYRDVLTGRTDGARALFTDLANGSETERALYGTLCRMPSWDAAPDGPGAQSARQILQICDALAMPRAAEGIRARLAGEADASARTAEWVRPPVIARLDLDLPPLVPPPGMAPELRIEVMAPEIQREIVVPGLAFRDDAEGVEAGDVARDAETVPEAPDLSARNQEVDSLDEPEEGGRRFGVATGEEILRERAAEADVPRDAPDGVDDPGIEV